MASILLSLGEKYLNDFIDFCTDKITDFIVDKIESLNYKSKLDPKNFGKQFAEQLISGFEKIVNKENFKDNNIFKELDTNDIKKRIMKIFEEKQISLNFKEEIENFQIAKISKMNILLIGDEENDIDEFLEIISKIFGIEKGSKMKINIEFNERFKKNIKINLIKFDNKKNSDKIINCIWYFNKDPNHPKKNLTKFNTNNISNEIPIISVYFKNKISNDNTEIFYRLNIPKNDLNYSDLFSNHIFYDNKLNEKTKEYFLNLIEKSIINILIKNNKFNIEKIAKEIKEKSQQRHFCFGNKIKYLKVFNIQMLEQIFKELLFGNDLPKSARNKFKEILDIYQKCLENHENSYYSQLLIENNDNLIINYRKELKKLGEALINEKCKDKDKTKLLYEIYSSIILFINEMEFYFEDDDDESEKTKKKNNKIKVNYSFGDEMGKKIKILFDDYFLKKSSIFINELIIDALKDIKIDKYNDESRDFYIDNKMKKEYVFDDNFQ